MAFQGKCDTSRGTKNVRKDETTIKSLAGALDFIKSLATGEAEANVEETRKDVFRTEENGWLVDTCCAFDTHKWETGIETNTVSMTIVEQYPDRIDAQKGHDKWVESMRKDPTQDLPYINVWETDDY